MKYTNLGGFSTINQYVNHKLTLLEKAKPNFKDIFDLMFSESSNVMFEESDGYKINKITYLEAKKNVDIIAGNIRQKLAVLREDTTIAIYLDNSHTWIETFWAILKCGCRPLLLNMKLDDDTLKYAMEITNTKLVISKGKIFSIMTMLESEIYKPNDIVLDKPFGKEFFLMSSATVRKAKVCAYSANEIKAILRQSREIIGASKQVQKHYNGELKLLALLPFYHIFGFVAVYLWFGFYSRTFIKLNDLSPATVQNTIKRHKVTHVFAVPLFWQKTYEAAIREIKAKGEKTYKKFLKGMRLVDKPVIGNYIKNKKFKEIRDQLFGDSISFMITGGGHISEEVLTFFNSIGYRLANGYGLSEIGITSVELSDDPKVLNSGSIGHPLFGVMYKIKDDDLIIKSIAQSRYVYEFGQVTKNDDRWYETRDIVKMIDGCYHIYGREDDLIISLTGENLNPDILEEKLVVENSSSVCLINSKNYDMPVLLVSINKFLSPEKANKVLEDVKNKINELNLTGQIGEVILVGEPLIREEEFKLNRKRVARDYYNGDLQLYSMEEVIEEEDDELSLNIKKLFAVALNKKVEEIHSKSDFFVDEGGTSLDYFVIVNKVNEEYGVNLSASEKPLSTVESIVNYIKNQL